MEFQASLVFKLDVSTVKDFAEIHSVSSQSIYHAMSRGVIDYTKVGKRTKLVILNERAQEYAPQRR